MDPIEAQIQQQIAGLQAKENFENYQPSMSMVNEPLVGIAPLVEQEKLPLPDLKQVAGNFLKNKAIEYGAKKLGLDAAKASWIISVLGMGSNVFAPLAAISALTGKSLGISQYLANKRAQKQMAKTENMLESRVLSNELAGQITPQDIIDDRGRGQMPSKTTKSTSTASRPAHQSAGIGGLHSDY